MIYLDRSAGTPLYWQVYQQLMEQIVSGRLPAGTLLPGIRTLAAGIGAGRNTVESAYGQLAAEGYIQAEAGRGYRVNALPPLPRSAGAPAREAEKEAAGPPVRYDLFYGSLSGGDFPYHLWKKELCAVLTQEDREQINRYPDPRGDLLLRTRLAELLFETRGVRCGPEQVLITSGLQGSLEILCKLLHPFGGVFAFEDPCYDKAAFLFRCHGMAACSIALDDQGALPESLPADQPVTSVYLTPSHQFPLGMTMPIGRRLAWLNWAVEQQAWIIEDDYDSEFSYQTNAIPSLQSIDRSGRVVYLGSFSKTLSPSFRMGYLVLPPALERRYGETMASYNCMVSWLLQRTLAAFIGHGHYRRLVRRTRTKFRRVHQQALAAIADLSPDLRVISQGSGLKFLLDVPSPLSREELIRAAAQEGVRVYSPARFWRDPAACPPHLIQIGLTAQEPADIPDCMARLKRAWFP